MTLGSTPRLHPDRLLPPDPATREVARRIYATTRDLPIISPHGHVDPRLLLDDEPFADPTSLLIQPDHYTTRLLHASGVPHEELGVGLGPLPEEEARRAWWHLCANWKVFRGTPVRYWLESTLAEVFGVDPALTPERADDSYDQIAARLTQPDCRPRALFESFRIAVLATTDDPIDDLSAHDALNADPDFPGRIVPTFRPDRYLEPGRERWRDHMELLAEASGSDTGRLDGWIEAMERRRAHFAEHGATASDHSHEDVGAERLDAAVADRLYRAAWRRDIEAEDATALRRHMMFEMARMAADDGMTMTLHPGVRRNHHRPTLERFGPDSGHDIPLPGSFTDQLRPMLNAFGTDERFTLVLFTLDETVFSREIAPLAGFYPSVHVGAPWWFLDAPEAVRRWRSAVTETAGFTRTSGFIDDTRAFCSIPVRHDMSRRLDAGYLAQLVAEHRLGEDEAMATALDLVDALPRRVFHL